MPNGVQIQVTIHRNIVTVRGIDERNAHRLFGIPTVQFHSNRSGQLQRQIQRVSPYIRDRPFGHFTCPSSRWNECHRILLEDGYEITCFDTHQDPLVPVDAACATNEYAWVQSLVDRLGFRSFGRLVVSTSKEREDLEVLVCRAFAQTNVVVVVPNEKTAEKTFQFLSEIEGERVTRDKNAITPRSRRILVCCPIRYSALDPSCFRVVLFPHLLGSIGLDVIHSTITIDQQRVYAIEDSRVRFQEDQLLRAEYLAGDRIFDFRELDDRLGYLYLETLEQSPQLRGHDAFEVKRDGIWNNSLRNDRIVQIAFALSLGRPMRFELPASLNDKPLRIAILVESISHARAIGNLLPRWHVLTRDSGVASEPTMIDPNRCIITRLWAKRQPQIHVDVLIRAEGEQGPLNLPGFSIQRASLRSSLLLIDFIDTNDLEQRQRHLKGYADEGFDRIITNHPQ